MSSNDGPYRFYSNVIVNSQAAVGSCPAKFVCYDESGIGNFDYTYFTIDANNVLGNNDGSIVNATTGELVPGSPHLGVAGFQLGATPTRRFTPGMDLRRSENDLAMQVRP